MRTHNGTGNNEADEARYFQTVEYEGGKKNDEQNQGKLQYRIAQRQRYIKKSRKQHRPYKKKLITTPVIKKDVAAGQCGNMHIFSLAGNPSGERRKTGSRSNREFVY